MRSRTLDSDQLGKKGQQHFGTICVSAGLVPNEATWDRKGWDYVVDWRHDSTEVAFDQRPTLPSCLVQVKTVWAGAGAIRAPLLALEHIAKDLKPAFIYVIPVNNDEEFSDEAFLAHLNDDLLALVLKSLRQARADGARLSKKELRLPLKTWFERIPLSGKALRSALEEAVGSSMGSYATEKQKKLKNLGFESGHMDLELKIQAESFSEFVDGFLGLKPLRYSSVSTVETRFGISIPIPNQMPSEGELHVQPKPIDQCKLIIRDGPTADPMVFKGAMYGPPARVLPPGELHALIRTELFDLRMVAPDITPRAKVKMNLRMHINGAKIRKARLPASSWSAFYNFLAAANDHPVSVEMVLGKGRKGPLSGMLDINLSGTPAESWPFAASVCNAAERVLRKAGWPGTKLSIKDISDTEEKLEAVCALLDDPSSLTPLSFVTSPMEGVREGDTHQMLYVDRFELGLHSLAYAVNAEVVASLKEDGIEWTSRALTVTKLERTRTRERELQQFLTRAQREAGLEGLLVNRGFIPKGGEVTLLPTSS